MKIHLVFGLITAVLLVIVISSRRQETVSFEGVSTLAATMAREGYLSATPALPKMLRDLTEDQYKQIHWKVEKTLWRKEGLPFQVRFFHPGFIYDRPVEIYRVNSPRPEPYSPTYFDFGQILSGDKLPSWVGYAGFQLFYPFNKPDALDEFAMFLGGSNFRAVARDLVYGASARALVVDPEGDGEHQEIPVFTKFWLKRPDTFSSQFTLYALMESRSVTGAYQFELQVGEETTMRVKAQLYFRRVVDQVGYAPLVSRFWYGENTSNTFGDFRPEVHRSDGLLLQKNNGEWLWHPLAWSSKPQLNIFTDSGPKGFGLLQRDRDFNHYQDLQSLFHKMPSIWVEPVKGFDQGSVHLAQQPTKGEEDDNVMAYWTPDEKPPLLQPVEVEYVLHWYKDSGDLPPLGRCLSTRVDLQDQTDRRQFFLDFAGGPLDRLKGNEQPVAEVASPSGATIADIKIERNDFNKSWRVSFFVTTSETTKPTEVLCRLMANGAPASETWTYTWMPQ